MINVSEAFLDELVSRGYSHCFFVAGGNIMHLINAARTRFTCIPVIHEVSAVIAAEYFNESNSEMKSFALVTAGPGLTNSVTGIAGAWLESRFVLVVGGQVKSSDLHHGNLRQKGIQELDGVTLVSSITKRSFRIDCVSKVNEIFQVIELGESGRPGPVFIEFCLDIQGAVFEGSFTYPQKPPIKDRNRPVLNLSRSLEAIQKSERPVLLIGGGVSRKFAGVLNQLLETVRIPTMTTWNALDRVPSNATYYFGRPNTWGQRYSNLIIQQCDLLIAVGTRLGLQQTGFNHESFAPLADVIQVDLDSSELQKGFPKIELGIQAEADPWLEDFLKLLVSTNFKVSQSWLEFASEVKCLLPTAESVNAGFSGTVNPYEFIIQISESLEYGDILVPCSSGSAFTVFMQAFEQKARQIVVSNKGLASMGYGLAGAIGASFANNRSRVILIEGDGGFAQNLQELATVKRNNLPIKMVIFDNGGYASIRMTQLNYFNGAYIGCDEESGLGAPDWQVLFEAYNIPCVQLNMDKNMCSQLANFLHSPGAGALLVPIHRDQTYYPKIGSRVIANGSMQSNPLHLMTPDLNSDIYKRVFRFLKETDEQN
jgi:acetolactate synthase-1/2/3 large subunit